MMSMVTGRLPSRHLRSFWEHVDRSPVNKPSLFERYEANKSPQDILRLATLNSKSLGKVSEDFARHRFPMLKPSKSNEFDHLYARHNHSRYCIEQKTSRLWENNDFKWQHIEPEHSWDFLLLCGIAYDDVKFWMLSRPDFESLVLEKKITIQGSKKDRSDMGSDEGYWCWYMDIKHQLLPVISYKDLRASLKT